MTKKVDKMQLIIILTQIKELLQNHPLLKTANRSRLLLRFASVINEYNLLELSKNEASKELKALFPSLLLRGERLVKELKSSNKDSREITAKINAYLRYLRASIYDFNGDLGGLNWYARCFTITAALFMALTPQFFGFVLPVFFLIPVFGGLRGVRKRSLTGLNMTMTVVPMALMTSITWMRYFFQSALPDFPQAVATTSQAWNVPTSAAQLLIIIPGVLSIILAAAALTTAYLGYKYRSMFV